VSFNKLFFTSLQSKITKLSETLKRQKIHIPETLLKDNECMKKAVAEWTEKCVKLERDGQDLERIVNEQSALMKALNVRKTFYFIFLFLREIFGCNKLQ
jgi:hypothetical protein